MQQANTILSWMENLLTDDRPPRWMWHLDEELADWFEMVKANHGHSDDDEPEGSMWENELAKDRG